MDSNALFYFLIANPSSKKEIGTYIDNSSVGNYIDDFNDIVEKSREILRLETLIQYKNKKNKLSLKNFNIYYTIMTSDTFYLAAVQKNSRYCKQENLLFELIEDIEHQGIKKLVDKQGELTNVGRQNLKFSIEKYQESNRAKLNEKNAMKFIEGMKVEPLIKEGEENLKEEAQSFTNEQKDKGEREKIVQKREKGKRERDNTIQIIGNNRKRDSKENFLKKESFIKMLISKGGRKKYIIILVVIIFIIALILFCSLI